MGQRLVLEVPDAWALLAGEGEEDYRGAVEEEGFSLTLVEWRKGELPCSAVLLLCLPRGARRGVGGQGSTTERYGGSACCRGTSPSPQGRVRFPAVLTWEQLGTDAWLLAARPAPVVAARREAGQGSLAPLLALGRAWLRDLDVSAQHRPAPTQVPGS